MGYGQYSEGSLGRKRTKAELLKVAEGWLDASQAITKATRGAANTLHFTYEDKLGGPNTRHGWGVILHETCILAFDAEAGGTPAYIVNLGGYNTLTTRARLAEYLPKGWSVYSQGGICWLTTPQGRFALDGGQETYWSLLGHHIGGQLADLQDVAQLKKALKAFIAKAKRGDFQGGDGSGPWIAAAGGYISEGTARDWLASQYVTYEGLAAALRWAGYNEDAIDYGLKAARDGRLPSHALSVLRRFLKVALGLA